LAIEAPYEYEFNLVKGDRTTRTVEYLIDGAPTDFTGLTVEWFFTCFGHEVIAATGSELSVDSDGNLSLVLSAAHTALLSGRGRHVLKIIAPYVRTLLEGEVIVYVPAG